VASAARSSARIDAGLLVGCVVLSFVAVALPTSTTDPIASLLRRTVVAPLVGLQRGAERWRTAWVSSEQRQLQVDSVTLQTARVRALDVENKQLRKLIGLGSRLHWGFVPAEALHSTAPIPNEELITSLTLTAGSTAGIRKYNPVVSDEGLVGQIQNADPTTSTAIIYSHPDFRASAMSADGSAFGVVYPHLPSARSGAEGYMLELRGVPARINLQPGTVLYTSGLGGVFPRGITIGTVMGELKTNEVWTHSYLVRPAVSPARVSAVLVLTAQRVTEGTGNVWTASVNVDSAMRRINTAGDSLARQAAVLEAQARHAALDSVRRATVDSMRRVLGLGSGARDSTHDSTHVRRDSTRADSGRRASRLPPP